MKFESITIIMSARNMANREGGAPNWRQGQEQPQHQDAAGQQHLHINWSNFKPEFFRETRRCRSTFAMFQ